MILMNENGPTSKGHEGKCTTSHYRQMIHAPNGMQLIERDGTPKHEMQKRFLISDRGMTRRTLTLAPMGMVAPWRCQEWQIFGRAD